jgi:ribosomal protein S12 methylthiotransferase accessory factor
MTASQAAPGKTYWRGTHRAAAPSATLARFENLADALGITRLANVTGLDYLGIPVFMAVRPNARSLSVSQGKGLDEASAAASAFMEAAELAHAELAPLRRRVASYAALKAIARAADPRALPRLNDVSLTSRTNLSWVKGMDLTDGLPAFVPFDLVHARFDERPRKPSPFFRGSNGLASGNNFLEAACAGICETIERDATSLWRLSPPEDKGARRLALGSVTDRDCRALLDRLRDRGIAVAVWDTTTDIGVACFLCRIQEAHDNSGFALGAFWGAGCHLSREVALARAITEAAQTRLTYIVGSRDDLSRSAYARRAPDIFDTIRDDLEHDVATCTFADVPSNPHPTFEGDLRTLLRLLRGACLEQVIAVDLTDERFGMPVVRIIVPGLESDDEHNRQRLGWRARARRTVAP